MGTETITEAPLDKLQAGESNVFYRSLNSGDEPLRITSAERMTFYTEDGQEILDACGGAAVSCLGNSDQRVIDAMKKQIDTFSFVYSAYFTHPAAEALAKKLIETSDGAFVKVGMVSGGSEAMEAVIKAARQYWVEVKEPQRVNFIARKLSYHGVTLGALSLCNHPARRAIYEPLLKHDTYHYVSPAFKLRFSSKEETEEQYTQRLADELDAKFQELGPDTVAAFCCETVVGATTGAVPPPKGYLKAMKAVCDKYGALFILDEVMAGMGRLGTLHGWQTYGDGARPDIQAIAKGLGAGYQPIGAMLINERVASAISKGSGLWVHGHTYQAHPIACAAALAVQNALEEDNLLANVRTQGANLEKLFNEKIAASPLASKHVAEVRGHGMLWGIAVSEIVKDLSTLEPFPKTLKPRLGERIVKTALKEQGLSILGFSGSADGFSGDHLVIAPAYICTPSEVETIATKTVAALETELAKL